MSDSGQLSGCLVCGRQVSVGEGIRDWYEGRELCFCSRECQARFETDPHRYVPDTECLEVPEGYV